MNSGLLAAWSGSWAGVGGGVLDSSLLGKNKISEKKNEIEGQEGRGPFGSTTRKKLV